MHSDLLKGRTAFVLGYTIVLLSCRSGRAPSAATRPQPEVRAATPSLTQQANAEDQVLLSVSKALRIQKLLARPDQCYAYQFDPALSKSFYTIEVSENHLHAECGGDLQTQPHLFTVHLDKSTRALSTDAQSPGIFHSLQP